MLDSYDALLKWAVLSTILAGLSVLAACAESAPFAFPGLAEQNNPAAVERRARTGPAPDQQALLGKIGPEVTTLLGIFRREIFPLTASAPTVTPSRSIVMIRRKI